MPLRVGHPHVRGNGRVRGCRSCDFFRFAIFLPEDPVLPLERSSATDPLSLVPHLPAASCGIEPPGRDPSSDQKKVRPCSCVRRPARENEQPGEPRVLAFLRRDGSHRGHGVQRIGSCLRDSEEWHRDRCHVGDAARAHHEVHHPRGHGGYHRHLRASGGCADSKQHQREDHPLQEFPASRGRSERGPERSGGWVRHWNRGRRRCSRHRPAAPALCGHDLDLDLR